MGIKGLKKYLRDKHRYLFEDLKLSDLSGERIAIDVMAIYFSHWCVSQGVIIKRMGWDILHEEVNIDDVREHWINLLWKSISRILSAGITPVMVFDGVAPKDKDETRKDRREGSINARSKAEELKIKLKEITPAQRVDNMLGPLHTVYAQWHSMRPEDISALRRVFEGLGIPTVVAPREAEEFCSYLCINSHVKAVYSSDTDNLAHGCPMWIHDLKGDVLHVIYYEKVLRALDFNQAQFLDFCILCGCDYNESIRLVGPHTSYEYIRDYRNIEGLKNIRKEDEINGLRHEACRTLFTDKTMLNINLPPLDIDKSSVVTYAETYLTPYRMEGLISETSTIYRFTNFEKMRVKIDLSKLGLPS